MQPQRRQLGRGFQERQGSHAHTAGDGSRGGLDGDGRAGLECLDYGEYDRTILEHCDLSAATDLFRVGDLVYVVMGSNGLAIVDIADGDDLQTLAEVTTPGWSAAVSVAGRRGGVVAEQSWAGRGAVRRERSSGAHLSHQRRHRGRGHGRSRSTRAFSTWPTSRPACGSTRWKIPCTLRFLPGRDTDGGARALAKADGRLYLAGQNSGLYVFDVVIRRSPSSLVIDPCRMPSNVSP